MDLTWPEVLTRTSVISCEQLARCFGITCEQAAADASLVRFQDALWEPRGFGQGAHIRHRLLLTEILLQMAPYLDAWEGPRREDFPKPDAKLRFRDAAGSVYLEADTGKESKAQWEAKLWSYRSLLPPPTGLWVVAKAGPARLKTLSTVLHDARLAIPWILNPLAELPCLPHFPVLPPPDPLPDRPPPPRSVFIWEPDQTPIADDLGYRLLAEHRARESGREIRHRELWIYLSPPRP